MSFLVVFNGQFSPLVYPAALERPSIRPVPSPTAAREVPEFKDILGEVAPEDIPRKAHPQLEAYGREARRFEQDRPRLYARDFMSRPVKYISQEAAAEEARKILERHGMRHLPVVNDQGIIVGMISDRELRWDLSLKKVGELMIQKVIVAEEGASLHEIAIILLREKINALPIINHRKELTGIITLSDILKYVIESTPFLGRG